MVSATLFKAWWERLETLAATDGSPRGARYLLAQLSVFGRRAGAIHRLAEESASPDPLPRTMRWQRVVEPAFDWGTGSIDFSPLSPDALLDPELIIADIVRLTGLPERTSEDPLPAASGCPDHLPDV
jgi:hypothetical protein